MNVTFLFSTSLLALHTFQQCMMDWSSTPVSFSVLLTSMLYYPVLEITPFFPALVSPDLDFAGNVSSSGTQGHLCVMSCLVPLVLLSHPNKTFSRLLCTEKGWTIDFVNLKPLFLKNYYSSSTLFPGPVPGFLLPLVPAPLMGNSASLSPLLTSQLLVARLGFFPLPAHPGASSCLLSKSSSFKGAAVIWEEAKCTWEPWGLCPFLSPFPLVWAAPYWAEALFSLSLFFLIAQTGS